MLCGLQEFLHTLVFSLYKTLNEAKHILYLFTIAIYTCTLSQTVIRLVLKHRQNQITFKAIFLLYCSVQLFQLEWWLNFKSL